MKIKCNGKDYLITENKTCSQDLKNSSCGFLSIYEQTHNEKEPYRFVDLFFFKECFDDNLDRITNEKIYEVALNRIKSVIK